MVKEEGSPKREARRGVSEVRKKEEGKPPNPQSPIPNPQSPIPNLDVS